MQQISVAWLYPIILIGGALQAWGPPMNGALRNALTNPWLAISRSSRCWRVSFFANHARCRPSQASALCLGGRRSAVWSVPSR